MQEEVENRTVALAVGGAKFTGRLLRSAIVKYLQYRKGKNPRGSGVQPRGKQTVKELTGQGAGVTSIEVKDASMREFDRIARRYGVDYAVKKVRGVTPPKYLVFFKARDSDALTAAMTEYSRKKIKTVPRPSVLRRLSQLKGPADHAAPERTVQKEMVR